MSAEIFWCMKIYSGIKQMGETDFLENENHSKKVE